MPLDVPYYAQTAEFSCGPACVVMALHHFDDGVGLTRQREFEVWRECNMVGVRGADPFGLAVPFLNRGHAVRIVTEREKSFEVDRWRDFFEDEEVELGIFAMEDNRRRALDRGVEVELRAPTLDDVEAAIDAGEVPVCMVHMALLHGEDIPHWVVATDIDEDGVTFHDPYPPKGREAVRVTRDEFRSIMDDIRTPPVNGSRSLLRVGPAEA